MNNVEDFTKARLGSRPRGRIIAKCPKCGRKGARTVYKDFTSYVHSGRVYSVAGFSSFVVNDHCDIKNIGTT